MARVTNSKRIILIKALLQGIIISGISVYALQCGLDDRQKYGFFDRLINFVRKFGKIEIAALAGDFVKLEPRRL